MSGLGVLCVARGGQCCRCGRMERHGHGCGNQGTMLLLTCGRYSPLFPRKGFQFLNQNRIVTVDAVTQRRRHPGLDWAALVLVLVLTLQTTGVWSWGGGLISPLSRYSLAGIYSIYTVSFILCIISPGHHIKNNPINFSTDHLRPL